MRIDVFFLLHGQNRERFPHMVILIDIKSFFRRFEPCLLKVCESQII